MHLGAGSGDWTVEVAEKFPDCRVLGIDLSPVKPTYMPPNCFFELFDIDDEWTYKQRFDLIYADDMYDFTSLDWAWVFSHIYDHLQPGAWFEMCGFDYFPHSDSASPEEYPALRCWAEQWQMGLQTSGRRGRFDPEKARLSLRQAGFLDIQVQTLTVPVGPWMIESQRLQEAGRMFQDWLDGGIKGMSLRCFKEHLFYVELQIGTGRDRVHAFEMEPPRGRDHFTSDGTDPAGSKILGPDPSLLGPDPTRPAGTPVPI